jgi:hypothetical protein
MSVVVEVINSKDSTIEVIQENISLDISAEQNGIVYNFNSSIIYNHIVINIWYDNILFHDEYNWND